MEKDSLKATLADEEDTSEPSLAASAASSAAAVAASALSAAVASGSATNWDPLASADWDAASLPASSQCLLRIKRDIMSIYSDPPHGIFVVLDETNMTIVHALIVGPYDTPYEGGLFYFVLRCPPDYPIRPPRVRLMTTGDNTVRFNPNFYRNGKVCLSILGTWSGPCWSPAQSLCSVLVSIQSLMNEAPYHNEPGFEQEHRSGDSQRYNQIIRHETLRVAVCDMLEGRTCMSCPQALKDVAKQTFAQFYSSYVASCETLRPLTLTQMIDPFQDRRGKFDIDTILTRLRRLKELIPVPNDDDLDDDGAAGDAKERQSGAGAESSDVSPSPMDVV